MSKVELESRFTAGPWSRSAATRIFSIEAQDGTRANDVIPLSIQGRSSRHVRRSPRRARGRHARAAACRSSRGRRSSVSTPFFASTPARQGRSRAGCSCRSRWRRSSPCGHRPAPAVDFGASARAAHQHLAVECRQRRSRRSMAIFSIAGRVSWLSAAVAEFASGASAEPSLPLRIGFVSCFSVAAELALRSSAARWRSIRWGKSRLNRYGGTYGHGHEAHVAERAGIDDLLVVLVATCPASPSSDRSIRSNSLGNCRRD